MPCLWFQIQGLDTGESQYDLDTVFRYLVPEQYKEGLRRYGGIGGISLDVSKIVRRPAKVGGRRKLQAVCEVLVADDCFYRIIPSRATRGSLSTLV